MIKIMLGKFGRGFFKSKIIKSPSDKCLSDLSFHQDVLENDVMDKLSNDIGNSISY